MAIKNILTPIAVDGIDLKGPLQLDKQIVATLGSGNNNNYAPTGIADANVLYLSAAGFGSNLTGISAGTANRVLFIFSSNVNALTIMHENTNSTAANRFNTSLAVDLVVPQGMYVAFIYNATLSRWVQLTQLFANPVNYGLKGYLAVGYSGGLLGLSPGADGHALVGDSSVAAGLSYKNLSTLKYVSSGPVGGDTISNTTTRTVFASKYTLPANSLAVGNIIRVRANGNFSTNTASPTLRFDLDFAGQKGLSISPTLANGIAGEGWAAEGALYVRSVGSLGTVFPNMAVNLNGTRGNAISNQTGNAAVNTTTSQTVGVGITWSAASTGNVCQLMQLEVSLEAV